MTDAPSTCNLASFDVAKIIADRRICVLFQPIVSIRDGEIWIVEALSRGLREDGTLIPPIPLFTAAAEQGVFDQLDNLCRAEALRCFHDLMEESPKLLLSLNIAGSLVNERAEETSLLTRQLREADISPGRVILEILEHNLPDLDTLQSFADRHRQEGFLIALDDVGAGSSNLNRITLLKPDILKFDRSLLSNLDKEYHKQEVVRALVGLCHRIGALAIAEGVERDVEAMEAKTLGFDLYQGFYFSRPINPGTHRVTSPTERITHVRRGHRKNTIARQTIHKIYKSRYMTAVDHAVTVIAGTPMDRLEETLLQLAGTHRALECLYILDADGRMATNSIFPLRVSLRKNTIFRPAQLGNDLSVKEYFISLRHGLMRYTSEPYISQATGDKCITISSVVERASGQRLILCLDFDLNMKRMNGTLPAAGADESPFCDEDPAADPLPE